MTQEQGFLYVFEGADGVGKSELSKRFAESLLARGIRCERLGFPGNLPGTLGHHVYRLHHDPDQLEVRSITSAAKQLLHIAAHVDAIETRILPLLRDGITVILDRFWWSTLVYGLAAGAHRPVIESMIDVELATWQGVLPTAAFLIRRDAPLRPEPPHLWPRWLTLYDELAATEAAKYPVHVVNNDKSPEEALADIASLASAASTLRPCQ